MSPRCPLCSSPSAADGQFCGPQCAQAAREAEKDGITARLRRAFARKRRPPAGPPDPDAEQLFFEVENLRSPGGAGAVEEILRVQPGVFDAYVVPETGRGRAFFDPERLSARDVLRALRRYGFAARTVRDSWARRST
jgi:hypothetical protein